MRRTIMNGLNGMIIVILITAMFVVSSSAATTNIGSTTHTYTYTEPVEFRIQGDVVYSKLSGTTMTITYMRSHIWNYSNSADDITAPSFIVEDVNKYHSTNSAFGYNGLVIAPGTSNYYTNVNWSSFTSGSNTYTIPSTSSQGNSMHTYIGAYAGSYYSNGIPFYYNAYWHGDGYIYIYNYVANTPYTWSKTVSTVSGTGSSPSGNIGVNYNVSYYGFDGNESTFIINVDSDYGVQFITMPKLSLEKDFLDCFDISSEKVITDGNTMTVSVKGNCDGQKVFIMLPDITVLDDDSISKTNALSLKSSEYFNKELKQRILRLEYSKGELPVIPQNATLVADDMKIDSAWTNAFFDDKNALLTGTLNFIIPENVDVPDRYALELAGQLVDIEGGFCSLTCLK